MDRLIRGAGVLSVLCLAAMVLVLVATLVLRPMGVLVPSSEIIVTFLMVGMAFFGLVYAYAEGVHVRVDALYKRIPGRLKRTVDLLSHLGAALLCGAIMVYSAQLTWTAWRFNDLSDGLVAIPMWIPLATVPVGFGLWMLALLRDVTRILRGQAVRFAVSEMDGAQALAAAAQEENPS
jgi:TRAP-type C4-dicarboxylate transport system permease small subunit